MCTMRRPTNTVYQICREKRSNGAYFWRFVYNNFKMSLKRHFSVNFRQESDVFYCYNEYISRRQNKAFPDNALPNKLMKEKVYL